ncbi:cobalt-precorrin 5A hydrolase [Paradesulfitobacterium ferrireducens]|uniref:cobalt-precorrin 5A hydrolase n=1 Tax=Paradesulfitobacterium ferrireducens TaxID=2816476 RepID=UPI001A8DD042|nr:cobalamin biosynthesis protein [Paradesulfitobacterium ferrireducens]
MNSKIAVIALTAQGLVTAERIKKKLLHPHRDTNHYHSSSDLPSSAYTVEIFHHEHCGEKEHSFKQLRELVPRIWAQFPILIFVMAAGIVVRQVSPLLQSKAVDPAVLVVDENAKFIIPLVSGHLGGANAWAREIAGLLEATAVITTATDGQGLVAPDEYARRLGWTITPLKQLPRLNRLLLEQKHLSVWSEPWLDPKHPLASDPSYRFVSEREKADLILTAFPLARSDSDEKVYLIPRILSLGIGCRRHSEAAVIHEGIRQALARIKAPAEALKGIFSIDLKAEESGLIQAAADLGIPFQTFNPAEIQAVNDKYQLSKSDFVRKKIGVDGVCEATSLLGIRKGKLILPKLKLNGVSLAISQEEFIL